MDIKRPTGLLFPFCINQAYISAPRENLSAQKKRYPQEALGGGVKEATGIRWTRGYMLNSPLSSVFNFELHNIPRKTSAKM